MAVGIGMVAVSLAAVVCVYIWTAHKQVLRRMDVEVAREEKQVRASELLQLQGEFAQLRAQWDKTREQVNSLVMRMRGRSN